MFQWTLIFFSPLYANSEWILIFICYDRQQTGVSVPVESRLAIYVLVWAPGAQGTDPLICTRLFAGQSLIYLFLAFNAFIYLSIRNCRLVSKSNLKQMFIEQNSNIILREYWHCLCCFLWWGEIVCHWKYYYIQRFMNVIHICYP